MEGASGGLILSNFFSLFLSILRVLCDFALAPALALARLWRAPREGASGGVHIYFISSSFKFTVSNFSLTHVTH